MKLSRIKGICWGNWAFFIIVTLLFVMTLLSGCGTKGDLYLPDKKADATIKQ